MIQGNETPPSGIPSPNSSREPKSTYGQILKTSAILGGTQGAVYLILIIRTKLVALLIGTSGIGIMGMYQSLNSFMSTICCMGIPSSGVREIANAEASGSPAIISEKCLILARLGWITGIVGCILAITLAVPISKYVLSSEKHSWAVAALGASLFVTSVSSAQAAILQGRRRISDLARVQLLSTLIGSVISIGLLLAFKESGIVPSIITAGCTQTVITWWFVRRIPKANIKVSWNQTCIVSRQILSLGFAFMWNSVVTCGVALATRSLIVRDLGVDQAGIFQAAWSLSGMFAGFILSAMGTDFFPRLTASASDHKEMNRIVNEQTEIGILLALPGLLFTLALAPWMISLLYTSDFQPASKLLPWFVLGVFGQIISWPLGYIQMAKGASLAFIVTQTIYNLLHLGLIVYFLKLSGLVGISIAFPVLYGIYTFAMLIYCNRLTEFHWSSSVIRLVTTSSLIVALAFLAPLIAEGYLVVTLELLLAGLASIITVKGLSNRLPSNHRLQKSFTKISSFLPKFR